MKPHIYIIFPTHNKMNNDTIEIGLNLYGTITRNRCVKNKEKMNPTKPS